MKMGKTSKSLLTVAEIIILFVVVFAGIFVLMKALGGGLGKERQSSGSPADPTPAMSQTVTPKPTSKPKPASDGRNLNGLQVTFTTWGNMEWDNSGNDYEKAYWEMQNQAMKDHNYTLINKQHLNWGDEYLETFMLGVINNQPIGSVVCIDNRWVPTLLRSGALMDVSNLPSADWSDEKFNRTVINTMSFNGGVYGFTAGMEPRAGVFFNKELLAAAGYSRELPYDLQASGQWDFEHFKELCSRLTRDVDNDGITDLYALSSFSGISVEAFLAANGTSVIVRDGTSGLKLNVNDRRVKEALSFLYDDLIMKGYYRMQHDEETWDFYRECFVDGRIVMLIEEQYVSENLREWNPYLNFGFVTMPKGPSADDYIGVCRENVWVLPNCEAIRSVADDIVYVYDIFTDAPEGMEDDDRRWKRTLQSIDSLDARAVNETCNWIINKWDSYMPYMNTYITDWSDTWACEIGEGVNPDLVLDANSYMWQQEVEEFNRNLKEVTSK